MTEDTPKLSEIVAKIKSRGYWEVVIRPLKFEKERLESLKDCANLVLENKVRLRGWDYPHVSSKYGVQSGDNWVENVTDWSSYEEFWRMYQSGQFLHLFEVFHGNGLLTSAGRGFRVNVRGPAVTFGEFFVQLLVTQGKRFVLVSSFA